MRIGIMVPKNEFKEEQQRRLAALGEVIYVESREERSVEELADLFEGVEILGADPDVLGGFEKARESGLMELMEELPGLKYVALASTYFGWIDLEYCRKMGIGVSNVPHYSTESVAEQTLSLMIDLAKKVILIDRQTQEGKYRLLMGKELRGRTLGVVGLGSIGTRVAELGKAVGMRVVGWNRTKKQVKGVEMMGLDGLLRESDVISINIMDGKETVGFMTEEMMGKMKKGVIVVNLADRSLVDEKAMAGALEEGRVESYGFWGEDLESGPLARIETAIGFRGFAYYTEEAMGRAKEIWVKNIETMAVGRPANRVL